MKNISYVVVFITLMFFLSSCSGFNKVTINVAGDGGEYSEYFDVKPNADGALIFDDPTADGSEFLGWYLDNDRTIPFDPYNYPDENPLKLYPKWRRLSFEIDFVIPYVDIDSMDFTIYEDQLPVPEHEGVVFDQWYTDSELTQPFDEDTSEIQSLEVRLYGNWHGDDDHILVEFKQRPTYKSTKLIQRNDEPLYIPGHYQNPIEEGYEFQGWYLDELYTQPLNYKQTYDEDLTLHAKWERMANIKIDLVIDQDNILTIVAPYNSLFKNYTNKIPSETANKISNYYLSPNLEHSLDINRTRLTNDFTLYAKLNDKSYLVQETIDLVTPDQMIKDKYIIHEGKIYGLDERVLYDSENDIKIKVYKQVSRSEYGEISNAYYNYDVETIAVKIKNRHNHGENLLKVFDATQTGIGSSPFFPLNSSERISKIISWGFDSIFESNLGAIIYDDYYEGYQDITHILSLDEDELLLDPNPYGNNNYLITSKDRYFIVSDILKNHRNLDIDISEDLMTEVDMTKFTNEAFLYFEINESEFKYLTKNGEYFLSSRINDFYINEKESPILNQNEMFEHKIGDYLVTNQNRIIYFDGYTHYKDVFDEKVESYIFDMQKRNLIVETLDNQIYLMNQNITHLTDQMVYYDLSIEDLLVEDRIKFKKDDHTYIIDEEHNIQEYLVALVSYDHSIPYDQGSQITLEHDLDKEYNIIGWKKDDEMIEDSIIIDEDQVVVDFNLEKPMGLFEIELSLHNPYTYQYPYNPIPNHKLYIDEGDYLTMDTLLDVIPDSYDIVDVYSYDKRETLTLPYEMTQSHKLRIEVTEKEEAKGKVTVRYMHEGDNIESMSSSVIIGQSYQEYFDIKPLEHYDLEGIYFDHQFTQVYNKSLPITEDGNIYVNLIEHEHTMVYFHLSNEEVIEHKFYGKTQITRDDIANLINEEKYEYRNSNMMLGFIYKDEAKETLFDFNQAIEDQTNIYVDVKYKQYINTINIGPNDYQYMNEYTIHFRDFLTYQEALDYLAYKGHVVVDKLYHDAELTDEFVEGETISGTVYYTTKFVDKESITVELRDDEKNNIIENITITTYPFYLERYLSSLGYEIKGYRPSNDSSYYDYAVRYSEDTVKLHFIDIEGVKHTFDVCKGEELYKFDLIDYLESIHPVVFNTYMKLYTDENLTVETSYMFEILEDTTIYYDLND